MKRLLFFFFAALLLCSCKPESEKIKDKVYQAIRSYMDTTAKSEGNVIDTLIIHKVDTLTPQKDSMYVKWTLYDASDIIQERLDNDAPLFDARIDLAKSLAYFGGSTHRDAKEDATRHFEKRKAVTELWESLFKRIDNINSLDSLRKIDTISNIGYLVLCSMLGATKAGEEYKRDSIEIMLSPNFRVTTKRRDILEYYSDKSGKLLR